VVSARARRRIVLTDQDEDESVELQSVELKEEIYDMD
jgi:hypothetical protein